MTGQCGESVPKMSGNTGTEKDNYKWCLFEEANNFAIGDCVSFSKCDFESYFVETWSSWNSLCILLGHIWLVGFGNSFWNAARIRSAKKFVIKTGGLFNSQ